VRVQGTPALTDINWAVLGLGLMRVFAAHKAERAAALRFLRDPRAMAAAAQGAAQAPMHVRWVRTPRYGQNAPGVSAAASHATVSGVPSGPPGRFELSAEFGACWSDLRNALYGTHKDPRYQLVLEGLRQYLQAAAGTRRRVAPYALSVLFVALVRLPAPVKAAEPVLAALAAVAARQGFSDWSKRDLLGLCQCHRAQLRLKLQSQPLMAAVLSTVAWSGPESFGFSLYEMAQALYSAVACRLHGHFGANAMLDSVTRSLVQLNKDGALAAQARLLPTAPATSKADAMIATRLHGDFEGGAGFEGDEDDLGFGGGFGLDAAVQADALGAPSAVAAQASAGTSSSTHPPMFSCTPQSVDSLVSLLRAAFCVEYPRMDELLAACLTTLAADPRLVGQLLSDRMIGVFLPIIVACPGHVWKLPATQAVLDTLCQRIAAMDSFPAVTPRWFPYVLWSLAHAKRTADPAMLATAQFLLQHLNRCKGSFRGGSSSSSSESGQRAAPVVPRRSLQSPQQQQQPLHSQQEQPKIGDLDSTTTTAAATTAAGWDYAEAAESASAPSLGLGFATADLSSSALSGPQSSDEALAFAGHPPTAGTLLLGEWVAVWWALSQSDHSAMPGILQATVPFVLHAIKVKKQTLINELPFVRKRCESDLKRGWANKGEAEEAADTPKYLSRVDPENWTRESNDLVHAYSKLLRAAATLGVAVPALEASAGQTVSTLLRGFHKSPKLADRMFAKGYLPTWAVRVVRMSYSVQRRHAVSNPPTDYRRFTYDVDDDWSAIDPYKALPFSLSVCADLLQSVSQTGFESDKLTASIAEHLEKYLLLPSMRFERRSCWPTHITNVLLYYAEKEEPRPQLFLAAARLFRRVLTDERKGRVKVQDKKSSIGLTNKMLREVFLPPEAIVNLVVAFARARYRVPLLMHELGDYLVGPNIQALAAGPETADMESHADPNTIIPMRPGRSGGNYSQVLSLLGSTESSIASLSVTMSASPSFGASPLEALYRGDSLRQLDMAASSGMSSCDEGHAMKTFYRGLSEFSDAQAAKLLQAYQELDVDHPRLIATLQRKVHGPK
jgi:hypothetical protein